MDWEEQGNSLQYQFLLLQKAASVFRWQLPETWEKVDIVGVSPSGRVYSEEILHIKEVKPVEDCADRFLFPQ